MEDRAHCRRHEYYGPWRMKSYLAAQDLRRHLRRRHPRMAEKKIQLLVKRVQMVSGDPPVRARY